MIFVFRLMFLASGTIRPIAAEWKGSGLGGFLSSGAFKYNGLREWFTAFLVLPIWE
jgi:hypothetical protein